MWYKPSKAVANKCWQACDLTSWVISSLVSLHLSHQPGYRARDGWFQAANCLGTLASSSSCGIVVGGWKEYRRVRSGRVWICLFTQVYSISESQMWKAWPALAFLGAWTDPVRAQRRDGDGHRSNGCGDVGAPQARALRTGATSPTPVDSCGRSRSTVQVKQTWPSPLRSDPPGMDGMQMMYSTVFDLSHPETWLI